MTTPCFWDAAIVIDKIPVALECHDTGMVRPAITRQLIEDALVLPGTVDLATHCIGDFFRCTAGIAEVIPALAVVDKGGFFKPGQVQRLDSAVQFDHVGFQFGEIALPVAPEQPGLSVVVKKDGGIDIVPTVRFPLGGHIISDESRAAAIGKGTGGMIRHGHADSFAADRAVVHGQVPVEPGSAFHDMTGPGGIIGKGPCKITGTRRGGWA